MVRTTCAVWAAVFALFVAGNAHATNAVDLLWRTGGAPSPTIGSASAAPPTTVTADVVLRGDAIGIAGVFVSFAWDYTGAAPNFAPDGNELDGRMPYAFENSNVFVVVSISTSVAALSRPDAPQ